jgi:hypothetical protein
VQERGDSSELRGLLTRLGHGVLAGNWARDPQNKARRALDTSPILSVHREESVREEMESFAQTQRGDWWQDRTGSGLLPADQGSSMIPKEEGLQDRGP